MKFSVVIEAIRNSDAIISATREGLSAVSKFSKKHNIGINTEIQRHPYKDLILTQKHNIQNCLKLS